MRLTLIGMSNVGKSYWSKKLEKKGFKRFCCDDLIEKKLEPYLIKKGYRGIADVSKWMGMPYDERYKKNSQIYIDFEAEVMKEILEYIESFNNHASDISHNKNSENIVIDTTGSVIHTNTAVLQKIKLLTTVVYLKSPYSVIKEMLESFIKNPKPVFWENVFNKKPGESNMDALKRCYPKLITYRSMQYNRFADIIIGYNKLRQNSFSVDDFISIVKSEIEINNSPYSKKNT